MSDINERVAVLEIEVKSMTKTQDKFDDKLEEISTTQVTGFNQVELHLHDLSKIITLDVMQRFERSDKRTRWLGRLMLSILAGIIVGIVMMIIKGL